MTLEQRESEDTQQSIAQPQAGPSSVQLQTQRIYTKHFIPLESNPEVFTELIRKLGVREHNHCLRFEDIYDIQDGQFLRTCFHRPHALVLVLPTTKGYKRQVQKEDAQKKEYELCGDEEEVLFFRQTINNACGLYAILHAIFNGTARSQFHPESYLTELLRLCEPLEPGRRALALETSKRIEQDYASVAKKGDTKAPEDPEEEVDYHYICFVKSHKNGHLYQLDGDRKRPIDHGLLEDDEAILCEKALSVIRSLIATIIEEEGQEVPFNLMALVSH